MSQGKPAPPSLDIPDLETDLRRPTTSSAPRAAPVPPPSRDLDDDFEFGSGVSATAGGGSAGSFDTFGQLDLDEGMPSVGGGLSASESFGGGALDLGGGDFDPDFDELEGSTTAAVASAKAHVREERRAWPTGVTRDADPTALDPRDVEDLSGYGPAPESVVLAPVYAARVFTRRRELETLVRRVSDELGERERERDDLLGRMVGEVRATIQGNERMAKLLRQADAAGEKVRQAKRELKGANAEYGRQSEALDQAMAKAEARLAEVERDALLAREAADEARSAQARLEAQEKRLYIELRPLAEARTALSPEQARRTAALERQITTLKPQVATAKSAARGADEKHEAAERVVDTAHKACRDLRKRRQALDATFGKALQSQSSALDAAVRELRERLAEAGRDVLAMKGTIAVPEATLDALVAADGRAGEQAAELLRHETALTSFDEERYKQGLMMMGVAVAVLVLLLLYGIVG